MDTEFINERDKIVHFAILNNRTKIHRKSIRKIIPAIDIEGNGNRHITVTWYE